MITCNVFISLTVTSKGVHCPEELFFKTLRLQSQNGILKT